MMTFLMNDIKLDEDNVSILDANFVEPTMVIAKFEPNQLTVSARKRLILEHQIGTKMINEVSEFFNNSDTDITTIITNTQRFLQKMLSLKQEFESNIIKIKKEN